MKTLRAVLAVMVGNVVGLLLIAIAGFVTVRYTPWGHWAVDASGASSAQLVSKYGDPMALIERGALLYRWIVGPVIALVIGAVAALVFRRVAWWVSTLSIVSLVVVLSVPTSLVRILATCVYIAMSWVAMKLVSSWINSSSSSVSVVTLPQK